MLFVDTNITFFSKSGSKQFMRFSDLIFVGNGVGSNMCVRHCVIASLSETQSIPKKAHTSWSVCSVIINNDSSFFVLFLVKVNTFNSTSRNG